MKTSKMHQKRRIKKEIDEEYVPGSDSNNNDCDSSSDSKDVPSNYFSHPSLFFVIWGPFVPPDEILVLTLTRYKNQSKVARKREEQRKRS